MTNNNGGKEMTKAQQQYMNIETGSVDTYDGWWYDDNGEQVNAVDRGEVVAVELVDGEYQEVR